MKKRTFSKEEKLRILEEAKNNGVQPTLDKHGVYPATYYSWKKKFESMGEAGFRHGMTPEHLKEIRRLEKENELLKKLLAEKDIESHLKDELLKKRTPRGSIPGRKERTSGGLYRPGTYKRQSTQGAKNEQASVLLRAKDWPKRSQKVFCNAQIYR